MDTKNIFIVVADVTDVYRNDIEGIENSVYEDLEQFKATFEKYHEDADYGIYNLSDFQDACNDEEINLNNSWITYITIKNL